MPGGIGPVSDVFLTKRVDSEQGVTIVDGRGPAFWFESQVIILARLKISAGTKPDTNVRPIEIDSKAVKSVGNVPKIWVSHIRMLRIRFLTGEKSGKGSGELLGFS